MEGKSYEDKEKILAIEPQRLIRYTHWSPWAGVRTGLRTTHRDL